MKSCLDCKWAKWAKTVSGKLHPSGDGTCMYPYKKPVLPASMYWVYDEKHCGGSINRHEQLKEHCVYYGKGENHD